MSRTTTSSRRGVAVLALALALGGGLGACGQEGGDGPGSTPSAVPTGQESTPTGTEEPEETATGTDMPTGGTATGTEAPTTGPVPEPCASPGDADLEGLRVRAGEAGPAALEKAQRLLDLATACDRDGLVALAEQDGTVVSLGATRPEEAFVSAPDADERIHAMVIVLSAFDPATAQEEGATSVRWPGLEDGLDDDAAARLVESGLYDQGEVDLMRDFGDYTGWRVVLDDDGRWTFMGAGE